MLLTARDQSQHLETHINPRVIGQHDVFPSASTVQIEMGSFVLQMATQEDRHAIVIFPPGPQSLDDIRFMRGGEEDTETDVKYLKRLSVSQGGGGEILLHTRIQDVNP